MRPKRPEVICPKGNARKYYFKCKSFGAYGPNTSKGSEHDCVLSWCSKLYYK